ncbi:glycosyltransferase family 4 protein [Geodermatophilus sp. SYSU D00691]
MDRPVRNRDTGVHAVTPYGRRAGSSRVRVHEWADRMQDAVEVHPYADLDGAGPRTLLRHPARVLGAEVSLRELASARPRRLLLHREASPLSRGRLEATLTRSAGVAVYDFDDALYTDTGTGPFYRRLAPKAAKVAAVLGTVDRVVAGNDTLANWAADHHRDVVVVPSCVDPRAYEPKSDYTVGTRPRVGWIGSWSTEQQLLGIAPALRALGDRLGARLVVVGAPGGHLGVLEDMVERVPWSPAAQRAALARFDVGVMPLADTPYTRGKCGYKLLQYLAAGVPSVASPIGVNGEILDRAGAPAARTTDEWTAALTALLEAPAQHRAALGARGRQVVVEHYSFDAWHERWRSAVFLDSA